MSEKDTKSVKGISNAKATNSAKDTMGVMSATNTTNAANRPIRILFVCHGNICRSPLAEFVMKDLVQKAGLEAQFQIASAATSTEELGNDVYGPTQRCMQAHRIPFEHRAARQIIKKDASAWDYLIGMDEANMRNMRRLLGQAADGKLYKLMEFAGTYDDVADPWYSGDFEQTYDDVLAGCRGLLAFLTGTKNVPPTSL